VHLSRCPGAHSPLSLRAVTSIISYSRLASELVEADHAVVRADREILASDAGRLQRWQSVGSSDRL
jgi:hypothetical protein